MIIRKATHSDLPEIWEMYCAVVKSMNARGLFQWDENYPTPEILRNDVELQQLYIGIINDEIVASAALNGIEGAPPEYSAGDWTGDHKNFCVFHRLAVKPTHQSQGLAKLMIAYLEQLARLRGATSMRIDTSAENSYAIKAYHDLGYRDAGRMIFYNNGNFVLFEKPL